MNGAQTLLALLGGAVVVITFIGTAVVYLRGSWDKGEFARLERAIESRDREIEGLRHDVARVEHEKNEDVSRLEHEKDALAVRVDALETENARLAALRPSAEAIAALDTFIREDHDVTAKKILEIVKAFTPS